MEKDDEKIIEQLVAEVRQLRAELQNPRIVYITPREKSFCGVCCTDHYVDEWPH